MASQSLLHQGKRSNGAYEYDFGFGWASQSLLHQGKRSNLVRWCKTP